MSGYEFQRDESAEWEIPAAHDGARRFILWRSIGGAGVRVQRLRFFEPDAAGHLHEDGDQLFFMISGSGVWRVDDDEIPFVAGDTLYVKQGVMHQLEKLSSEQVEYLLVHIPLEPVS